MTVENEELDLKAASRIARRVDLKSIHLLSIDASCDATSIEMRPLTPSFDHSCEPLKSGQAGIIEVACNYTFKVKASETNVADAKMTYRIIYTLNGDEPTEESDIRHFARANGAYHSWPFARETIFGLTSRMGFPPYTLPVLSFHPKPKPKPAATETVATKPANTSPPSE